MPPFFTIITSTYNAAATLPRLLDSLASQTCRDFNWIVQDGASSDATIQIVEQYRDRLPEVLADSGKDSGIYDAWNKAIDRWQDKMGEWVLFLGADDKLADVNVLQCVQEKINRADANTLFAAGNIEIYNISTEKSIKNLKVSLVVLPDGFAVYRFRIQGFLLISPSYHLPVSILISE